MDGYSLSPTVGKNTWNNFRQWQSNGTNRFCWVISPMDTVHLVRIQLISRRNLLLFTSFHTSQPSITLQKTNMDPKHDALAEEFPSIYGDFCCPAIVFWECKPYCLVARPRALHCNVARILDTIQSSHTGYHWAYDGFAASQNDRSNKTPPWH